MITAGRGRRAAGTEAVTIEQACLSTGSSRRSIQMALRLLRSNNAQLIAGVDGGSMTLNAAYGLLMREPQQAEAEVIDVVNNSPLSAVQHAVD